MRWELLSGIPEEEVQQLLSVARRRTFQRGEVVFHQDDPGDSLHLVEHGRFAVRVATRLGDTVTLAVKAPGDYFGELALAFPDSRRSATVAALEDGETRAVRFPDFERLRKRHPKIDRFLLNVLAEQVRHLNELIIEALWVPAEQRLLRRLLELGAVYGDGDATRTVPLTQEELGSLAGTSRATVNRVLREEERRGNVQLDRGRTVILRPDEMARRAGCSTTGAFL